MAIVGVYLKWVVAIVCTQPFKEVRMMPSRIRNPLVAVTLGIGLVAAVTATARAAPPDEAAALDDAAAIAAVVPGANQFVSGLDLECFDTPGPALGIAVTLTHLNPVLRGLGLPAHNVIIRELQQTCVPVAKNGVAPQPAALPFIRHVDLACYRVDAAPLAVPQSLTLKHLNPVLAGLPAHGVTMVVPAQLCLPVGKNGVAPPPDALRLAQFIDLECYRVDPGGHPVFTVNLRQLNPQLANIAPHNMTLVANPRQLCVPVQKNAQVIPPDVLGVIQWIDLEKFAASPLVATTAINVTLNHLNPLFTTLPRVPVVLRQASALMVPVSKNGAVPPPP
jgi:hypothetical protein